MSELRAVLKLWLEISLTFDERIYLSCGSDGKLIGELFEGERSLPALRVLSSDVEKLNINLAMEAV